MSYLRLLAFLLGITAAACVDPDSGSPAPSGDEDGGTLDDAGLDEPQGDIVAQGSFQALTWNGCVLRNTRGSVPRPALGFQMVTGMLASMHKWATSAANTVWWTQYAGGSVDFYKDANSGGGKQVWASYVHVGSQPLWRSNDARFELEFWGQDCQGYGQNCWNRFKVYHKATSSTYATMHPTEMPTLADRDQYTTWVAIDSFPNDPARTYDAMCPGWYTGDPEFN